MEFEIFWLLVAIFTGTYLVLFGFLRRVNEWYHATKLGEKRHSLPPGDMGWPFLGNMWSFLRDIKSPDPDTFIKKLEKRNGRTGIYKTHLFGSPSIIVSTTEISRRVLMDDERFTSGYPRAMKILAGDTFISVTNSEHKYLRKLMISPMNDHEALSMHIGNVEDVVIASLEEWASKDRPIEFLNAMRKLAFKVIFRMLLGSRSDSTIGLVEKYIGDFHYGFQCSAINIPGFGFYSALKARKMIVKILQTELDNRRAMKKSDEQTAKGGMMDLIMEVEDDNGKKLEDKTIIDLVLASSFAGLSTPAHISMWATIYLHQHSHVLQKAKEEQEEIIKNRPHAQKRLNLKEIRQMKYLAKLIDETLRFFNLPFSDFRETLADANIKGYIIPKGWKVYVWTKGIHMDPENYPNPEEYDPSRWDNHKAKPGSFIPFGAGSRRCIGADMAKLEISILLHYFLLNYKFEQLNPESPTVLLPQPHPSDNCLAKVIKLK